MRKFLAAMTLFFFSTVLLAQQPPPPTTLPPLNSAGVATGCNNTSITCTYTDVSVPVGQHFYFVVAATVNGYSTVSNKVDVTVTSGQNVVLNWNPSATTSPVPTYYIYRGAPPTNLQNLGVH
jgi:hypothetical protein